MDVRLAACWLQQLDADRLERFHYLRQAFKEERREHEQRVDASDRREQLEQLALRRERRAREQVQFHRHAADCANRRAKRQRDWAQTVLDTSDQRARFEQVLRDRLYIKGKRCLRERVEREREKHETRARKESGVF